MVLKGTLAGHPARFLVDTGSNVLFVTSAFARANLAYVPSADSSWANLATPHPSPPAVKNVSGTLAGMPFKGKTFYVVEQAGGVDVLLGAPFFSRSRVTMDFRRKVLLLEE